MSHGHVILFRETPRDALESSARLHRPGRLSSFPPRSLTKFPFIPIPHRIITDVIRSGPHSHHLHYHSLLPPEVLEVRQHESLFIFLHLVLLPHVGTPLRIPRPGNRFLFTRLLMKRVVRIPRVVSPPSIVKKDMPGMMRMEDHCIAMRPHVDATTLLQDLHRIGMMSRWLIPHMN